MLIYCELYEDQILPGISFRQILEKNLNFS